MDTLNPLHSTRTMRLLASQPTLVLLLCFFSSSTALAGPPIKGIAFDHGDWTLACDNTRTCRAAGYQPDDGEHEPVSVLLTRQAGPDQRVTAELMLGRLGEIKPPLQLSLQINDAKLGALNYNAADGTAALPPAQVSAMLAALMGNSRIALTGDDGRRWTLSDRGASAVLLKMDEFQGRIGTPGALVRKGTKAESTVLPAVSMPIVKLANTVATRPADKALAVSAALRDALVASISSDDCEALQPTWSEISNEGPQEMKVQRLSADKLLVSHLCWRGAYNRGDGYWVINDRPPYHPRLVTNSGSGDDLRSIEEWHRGRGLADCIYSSTWSWNGARFVQTAVTSSGLCRSITLGGPWNLPTLVTKVQK
ncbi:DUF1176 domain-containing protein [Stenotrophomonas sp.]|uniref:DUF1176 domain-containing protein n=1 Tax=Stenotrophomonas sp. TaxID=69392 RepID=UPI002FC696C3